MRLQLERLGYLLALSTLGLAASAKAQGLTISYAKQTQHGNFALELSSAHIPTFGATHHGWGHHAPPRVWVAGHYEYVMRRVWVPGTCTRVWIEPIFATRWDACGRAFRVCVREGYWDSVTSPGHFEDRGEPVWVAGCWRNSTY